MLIHLRKNVCIALVVSAGCLPLATLHAQTMGAENSAVVYNDQGDIRSDSQSSQYRYNALNQLTYDQASKSKKTINYQYYATGMQASEAVVPGSNNTPSTMLYHYYAGQGKLLNSTQDNNFSGYLLANGMALRSYQSASSSQAQIYVRNSHSSVITTINDKATQIQQYNAYGATILSSTSSSANTLEAYGIHTSPLGYSNYPFDEAAAIYYLKARYYAPFLRSFISRDTYDLANRYDYVNDNTMRFLDPTGHQAQDKQGNKLPYIIVGVDVGVGAAAIAGSGYMLYKESGVKKWVSAAIETSHAVNNVMQIWDTFNEGAGITAEPMTWVDYPELADTVTQKIVNLDENKWVKQMARAVEWRYDFLAKEGRLKNIGMCLYATATACRWMNGETRPETPDMASDLHDTAKTFNLFVENHPKVITNLAYASGSVFSGVNHTRNITGAIVEDLKDMTRPLYEQSLGYISQAVAMTKYTYTQTAEMAKGMMEGAQAMIGEKLSTFVTFSWR